MAGILIVDDSEFQREKLMECLSPIERRVETASTGQVAVALARRSDFDVILMDIVMPEMNGIDAISQIRADGVSTPIVLCTTVTQTEKMKQAIIAGADEYVQKPYDQSAVLATVESVLNED
jgi:two-component system chemotaxis response regulator CheY